MSANSFYRSSEGKIMMMNLTVLPLKFVADFGIS